MKLTKILKPWKTKNPKKVNGITMVYASFRKVVAFDLLFFGIGIVAGMGIGVYLIAGR